MQLNQLLARPWKSGAWILGHAFCAWIGISLMGYGMALDQFDLTKRRASGTSTEGVIVSRSALAWGYLSPICIHFGNPATQWCIKRSYIDPATSSPYEVYRQLAPGTRVGLKGIAGYVMEMWIPPSTSVIRYNYAIEKVQADLRSSEGGSTIAALGALLVLLPLVTCFILWRRQARGHKPSPG